MTDDDLDPRARAAETKKQRTREKAINATLDLFTRDAISVSRDIPTIEQVAEAGHIGVATIYTHFGTKYGLYQAALDQLFELLIRPIRGASEMGAYDPPDLRSEIISYVCKAAIIAHEYRHLVTSYIQAFFEARAYDPPHRGRISQSIQPGLSELIAYGQKGLDMRFNTYPHAISYHTDMLLLLTCGSGGSQSKGPAHVAQEVLLKLLPDVDRDITVGDFPAIRKQIEQLVPKDL